MYNQWDLELHKILNSRSSEVCSEKDFELFEIWTHLSKEI